MTFKERWNRDRQTLRSLDKKQKGIFLWDYYKVPILAVAAVLILVPMALISWASRKDVAMYAVFVNSDAAVVQTRPEILDDLLREAGVDMEGKAVDITADLTLGLTERSDTDGQTVQVLAALFGISGLDVFAADRETFDRYAVQDAFLDLSLFLEPELYENSGCTPYWYENGDGQQILGGLLLHPGSRLHEAGYYHGDVMLGVAANAENLDEAVAFAKQLAKHLVD